MSRHGPLERVLFWAAVAVIVLGLLAGSAVMVANWPPPPAGFAFTGFHIPIAIAFGGMGLLLVRRRPGNRIGWLLVAEAAVTAVQFGFDRVAATGYAHPTEAWAPWLAWVSSWIWTVAITPLPIIFLLYPNGRPLSDRWGRLVWVLVLGDIVAVVGLTLTPGPIVNFPRFDNPIGYGGDWAPVVFAAGGLMILAAAAGSVLSLVIRWRRSIGDEREQMKWLAFVGIPMVVVAPFSVGSEIAGDLLIAFGVAMPVAIAIAVLRHQLYDIDELIGRTVVYGVLTAILAGVYAASLKLLQEVFLQVTGTESDGAVILSTLVTAASFAPVRKGLDSVVDRRFKRSAPDAASLLPTGAALAAMSPSDLEELVRRAVRAELDASAVGRVREAAIVD